MKRDMIYGSYNMGGVMNPANMMLPSGYNATGTYNMYGPNIYNNDIEGRVNKIESQIEILDNRLKALESNTNTNNMYML